MERTKKVTNQHQEVVIPPVEEAKTAPLLRWRKIGGGSLRFANRIIKPGEIFYATLDSIPKVFLDTLQCLEEKKLAEVSAEIQKEEEEVVEKWFIHEHEVDGEPTGGYDLVSAAGKVINEKPMSSDEAEELKKALEA